MRALVAGLTLGLIATTASARPLRPRFEPTDLELVTPGALEIDHQSGISYGGSRLRPHVYVASDFELNLGLGSNLELDIDGGLVWDNTGSVGHWMGDPLWTSVKLGMLDWHRRGSLRAIALGLQLGPRLPTLRTGRGIGYGALGLLGLTFDSTVVVLNGGYVLDPGITISKGRPSAFIVGLDVNHPLGQSHRFALLAELATVQYLSPDPNEMDASVGLAWDPNDHLEFSLVLLGGQMSRGDRLAMLFGVSPTIDLL